MKQAASDDTDTRSYNAPGHLAGQFEDAGYAESKWDGYFGFQPKHQIGDE